MNFFFFFRETVMKQLNIFISLIVSCNMRKKKKLKIYFMIYLNHTIIFPKTRYFLKNNIFQI